MGWQIDDSWTYDIEEMVEVGMQEHCDNTALRALQAARQFAPNPSRSRGYALGALMKSGYVISPTIDTYETSKSEAEEVPGTRIVVRGQVEGKFDISTIEGYNQRGFAVAVLDFPLAYADLIRSGFHHRKAKKFIIGVDYITSAVNKTLMYWEDGQGKLVRDILKLQR